jgi:hypothetical protein
MSALIGGLLWRQCSHEAPITTQYTTTLGALTQTYTLGSKIEIGYMTLPVAVKIQHDSKILSQITNGAINSGLGSLDNSTIIITPTYKLQWGWQWQQLQNVQTTLYKNNDTLRITLKNVPMPTVLDTTKTIESTEKTLDAFYEGIFVDAAQIQKAKTRAYAQADSLAVAKYTQTLNDQTLKNLRACALTLFATLNGAAAMTQQMPISELIISIDTQPKGLQGKVTKKGFEVVGGLK